MLILASFDTVMVELMFDIDRDDDGVEIERTTRMSQADAFALMRKHKDIFDTGVSLRSGAYYVAVQIIKAERKS